MRIDALRIQNFLSLIDVRLTDLPNLVVLIGKNSSGKSNILHALSLLFENSGKTIEVSQNQDDVQHLFPNYDIDKGSLTVTAELSLTLSEWGQLLQDPESSRPVPTTPSVLFTKLLWKENDVWQWRTYRLVVAGESVIQFGEPMPSTPVIMFYDEDQDSDGLIEIHSHILACRFYELLGASFQEIDTVKSQPSWDRIATRPAALRGDQLGSLLNLARTTGVARKPWSTLVNAYGKISPNRQEPIEIRDHLHIQEPGQDGGLEIPIGMTGLGGQSLLALMDGLRSAPSITWLEEPEAHMHPTLAKQAGGILRESAEHGRQIFVSTHSPFLLDKVDLSSIVSVRHDGDQTHVTRIKDSEDQRTLLGDLGVRPSDILFCNAVLIVNGQSDQVFFGGISELLDISLSERHIAVIDAGGDSRATYKIGQWSELGNEAGIPVYAIYDKKEHEQAKKAINRGDISSDRCKVLDNGDLEDYYPWHILQEALNESPDMPTVEEEIPVGKRVAVLKPLMQRCWDDGSWKPALARRMVDRMSRADVVNSDLVSFLVQVHKDLG